jgi:hypothetical protein
MEEKMKAWRSLAGVVVVLATVMAMAQSQSSFDRLKALAGTWEGKAPNGRTVKVLYRVTSNGSALLSEIQSEDDMITMFHPDGDRLLMTHYCGAGNQPRMQGTTSPDGKTITFNYVDATNLASPETGHMHRLVLNLLDANHHTQEWTFKENGKEMTEKFSLERTTAAN